MARNIMAGAGFALLLSAPLLQAAPDITSKSGWSGFVNIGAGAGQSETNMIAGVSSIDLGDERISSLDEDAGSEDVFVPAVAFEANYTLGESQTQFYLRNQASRHIAFDLEVYAGVRQQIERFGILDLALSSTSVPTDVWKDPYLLDARRGDTERTTTGLQMAWRNVMDSAIELEFSSHEIEIDDEDSGDSLGLSGEELRALRRTGEVYRYTLSYDWQINQRHSLQPVVEYLDYDLDGGAMAEDGFGLRVTHGYHVDRWNLATEVYYRDLQSDEDNPIYGESADREVIGAAFTVLLSSPFGLDKWTANARISWYDSDSDIDFYDENLALLTIGMLRRFD